MQTITLSQLAANIRETLETGLLPSYWVVAEIGDLKVNAKGHCYMELVEKEGREIKAKLKAAIWAYDFHNISQWFTKTTGTSLSQGIKILANAQVKFHEVYGLNITIKDIDPKFTLGERQKHRQEVMDRLAEEQLLDRNKLLPLPPVPQRIAVVSSPTAAGYGDFCQHLGSYQHQFATRITLFPASLQGRLAEAEIVAALREIYLQREQFDVIAIIRGGGGQLDFEAFNEYHVCRAIALSSLPVLTGIGHEQDDTLADRVAHTRLKTPTAVADFILEAFGAFTERLEGLSARLQQSVNTKLVRHKHWLEHISKDIQHLAGYRLSREGSSLRALSASLLKATAWQLRRRNDSLKELRTALMKEAKESIAAKARQLDDIHATIKAGSPEYILSKGYTITLVNGQLPAKANPKKGDRVVTIYTKGRIESEILEMRTND